ncbi:MAG: hypothetical protein HWD85_00610 [Flavobacteriaceae bacterium]|nr:hypothetical protein [Flavobacteriaceae bacterium]
MLHKEFQPLRIYQGWEVTYNLFFEEQFTEENIHQYPGPTLLNLYSSRRNQHIDVSWQPEGDIKGSYILQMFNTREVFNEKNNLLEVDFDDEPHTEFKSKNKDEIVSKLEDLMWFSKGYKDPRILKNRGVVDEPSESYRIELEKEGLTQALLDKILKDGNRKIQDLILDHKDITKEIIERFFYEGCSNKVKNKAAQMMKQKKFR